VKHLYVDHLVHKACIRILLFTICMPIINGCAGLPASLSPKSNAAAQITGLWWVMFGLGAVIWIGVTVLLLVALFRRHRVPGIYAPLPDNDRAYTVNIWIVGGGIVMPTLVLIGLVALTVGTLRSIPAATTSAEVVVEVIGHQWWWEVRYPDRDITLTNEIRIPTGEPVQVRLSSTDVIHSFWVPELHGKFDLIPGRTQVFILQADQPGEYRGQCAEFCGLRHARMTFTVVAMPKEEFTLWLKSQSVSAVELDDS
jgi:cytochrome c oxidase subunit II